MELSGEALAGFFATVMPHLDERQTRVVAGAMVKALGRGGQARVVEASALSSSTVNRATREVEAGLEVSDRQRVPGAGAKPVTETQPHLLSALDDLVAPETRGNPMSLLRWTLKSTYGFGQGSAAGGVQGVGGDGAVVAPRSRVLAPSAREGKGRGHAP